MNMPVNENGAVTFNTTLFALIRTSLNIKLKGNMNANDTELRNLMKRLWPKDTEKKVLDKLIPKQSVLSSQQMTIGKIYCAKLIHENYKYSKSKAQGGIERGYLRKLVAGSMRGYHGNDDGSHGDKIGFNPPRPRSRTLEGSRDNLKSNDSRTPSDATSYLQGNNHTAVSRSHSWSNPKANGDLEMIELKPVPTKKSRNGKPRTSDDGSNKPIIPLQYLTVSPKTDRKGRNNSYKIAVDLNPRDEEEAKNPTNSPKREKPAPKENTRQSRDSKYYDDMITRINEQLTQAVESGQSPYAIYGMSENDENEWC